MNNRDRVQQEAIEAIIKNKGRGILTLATGIGKSKITIDYANKIRAKSIALIVPTQKLRDENWKDEFIKWDSEKLWNKVIRICYQSAHKIKDNNFDLVIMDELHSITELNSQFFDNNYCKDIIGLTATFPKEDIKKDILKSLGLKVIYNLDIDQATELGIVSPFKITVIYTKLDDKVAYIPAGNKIKSFLSTEKNQYNYINTVIRKAKNTYEPDKDKVEKKINFLLLKRMRLIYNLRSKANTARYFLNNYINPEERTLVFCGSIDQANNICKYKYHSESGDEDYNKFKSLKINQLSCVQSLDEGENIPLLDNAIIVQLNSQERNLIQRIGRLIRYREGHTAKVYIFCCLDTQDEVWLNKSLENFDKNNIEYKTISNFK